MKITLQTDLEIWNMFRAGDREAFARIFEQHYRQLYSYGKQFLVDVSLTEDAIQDLFINLWRTRENLSEVDNIKFYLFRSLRRNIRRLSEREKRLQHQDVFQTDGSENSLIHSPDFGAESEESLLTRRLKSLIENLPKRQREVVMLRYYENFSTHEIALIMGVTEKTVRNTLFNAMTTLRGSSSLLKACLGAILLFLFLS
ncbi:RNA polymerase sigma factor [Persicitalea jodogahamensis]|uniref:Siderophore-interacting protein n=1 Tax=Persicitalea jodogahamensis TaxID=402147 RepID=A0A8J3G9I3_9BACT|nr:sigma-70 family RNA polymerase sigma factor [Persicitalea jodogahamensis]GHB72931.1 siderophore-interacting protein [Persicitalea jodogahamensis]